MGIYFSDALNTLVGQRKINTCRQATIFLNFQRWRSFRRGDLGQVRQYWIPCLSSRASI